MPALILPPETEAELLAMAHALAGRALGELAARAGVAVPPDLRRDKGWIGNLVEALLGATASSLPVPDFERIGVELKTIPVTGGGRPLESTYVTTVPMGDLVEVTWEVSKVRHKLERVLWVPIDGDPERPLAERRVHDPVLWSPSEAQWEVLREDWEEITDLVRMGQVDLITAEMGEALQVRPKAARADAQNAWTYGEHGFATRTLQRGFYLRPSFTGALLKGAT